MYTWYWTDLVNGIRTREQRVHVVQSIWANPVIARLPIVIAQSVIDLHIHVHLVVERRTLELAALPEADVRATKGRAEIGEGRLGILCGEVVIVVIVIMVIVMMMVVVEMVLGEEPTVGRIQVSLRLRAAHSAFPGRGLEVFGFVRKRLYVPKKRRKEKRDA